MPGRVIEAPQMAGPGDEALDVEDGLADEQRRDALQRGDGALRREGGHRLADADEAVVGLDLDEDHGRGVVHAAGPVVWLLEGQGQRRGLDAGDLHGVTRQTTAGTVLHGSHPGVGASRRRYSSVPDGRAQIGRPTGCVPQTRATIRIVAALRAGRPSGWTKMRPGPRGSPGSTVPVRRKPPDRTTGSDHRLTRPCAAPTHAHYAASARYYSWPRGPSCRTAWEWR